MGEGGQIYPKGDDQSVTLSMEGEAVSEEILSEVTPPFSEEPVHFLRTRSVRDEIFADESYLPGVHI